MDGFVEAIKETLLTKTKAQAVKQDCDRVESIKRDALKAFRLLQSIPDASKVHSVMELQRSILASNELKPMWEHVLREEAANANGMLATVGDAEMPIQGGAVARGKMIHGGGGDGR